MNYSWLTVFSILGLSFVLGLKGISQTPTNIILKYDFESGNFRGVGRQYQDKTCSQSKDYINRSLFQIVDAPGGRRGKAVKHHILNCDERSELIIGKGFLKNNQEYWIGWSHYLPENFLTPTPGQPNYTIVQQMGYQDSWIEQIEGKALYECHRKFIDNKRVERTIGPGGSDMVVTPDGKSYKYKLKYYKGMDSKGRYIFGCKDFIIPAKLNQWEDFVMNFVSSGDAKVGYFKLWKNDKLYINQKVALSRPGVKNLGDWHIGLYVGDPNRGERIIYTDELKVGNQNSSFNEVSPQSKSLFKFLEKQFSFGRKTK